jgi:ferredoxin
MSTPSLTCHSFKVRIQTQSGEFVAPQDQTVLQSALDSGYTLASSCRNGVCRTCLCRLHSGRISYRMDWPGLSAEEKAEGLFLPCVAYPASDLLMQVAAPGD